MSAFAGSDRRYAPGAPVEEIAATRRGVRVSASDDKIQIEMPDLGSGDAEADAAGATLASWLVAVGDTVEAGEVIAELETDKATVELESPAAGRIASLDVEAGTEGIAPGRLLGTIEGASPGAGREADATADGGEPDRAAVASAAPAPDARDEAGGPRTTPLARRVAEAHGVDLGALSGSGSGGRIVQADVLRAATGGSAASEADSPPAPASTPVVADLDGAADGGAEGFRSERLSAMRKTIARRMTESKQTVPHFYLRMRVAMDELIAVRARLNAELAESGRDVKISVNDFVVRAAALALRDVPAANVQFAGKEMHVFERVDVSVAVATDGGLITPVVRDADRLGLVAIAEEVARLAERARSGQLEMHEYQGGTFTISNLGMYGIDTVYPILNLPQACILGVGAAEEEPVVRDGAIAIGRRAAFTLAADHRAVDGAVGAQLLAALRSRLEDPLGMML